MATKTATKHQTGDNSSVRSHKSTSSRGSKAHSEQSRDHHEKSELDKRIIEELEDWEELRRQRQREDQQNKEDSEQDRERQRRMRAKKKKDRELKDLRERLLEASERRDAGKLRKALEEVDEKDYEKDLKDVYDKGVDLLRSIDNIEHLEKARKKLDHTTVVELRNVNNMAEVVHDVCIAAFMLLGYTNKQDDEHQVPTLKVLRSSWAACQREFQVSGQSALHKRMMAIESNDLKQKTVCDALAMLDKYDRQFVSGVSGAAGLVYDWVQGMCEEKLLADEKTASKRSKETEKKKKDKDNNKNKNKNKQDGGRSGDESSDDEREKEEDEKYKRCEHCQIKPNKDQKKPHKN